MVDWSARSTPATGRDSLWCCLALRSGDRVRILEARNPPTRELATGGIRELLRRLVSKQRRVLVGFDFSLGYPTGFAAALGAAGRPWSAVWEYLHRAVRDTSQNANNRFRVASRINSRVFRTQGPFWGCPPGSTLPSLSPRHPGRPWPYDLAEYRLVEDRARSAHGLRPQSAWKLAYAGAVGGQTLLGIPRLQSLRTDTDLAPVVRVWPFDDGLRAPRTSPGTGAIVLAEVYPSLVAPPREAGPVPDRVQVETLALHFARLDANRSLAGLFRGDPRLTQTERRRVEEEEGWILGIT